MRSYTWVRKRLQEAKLVPKAKVRVHRYADGNLAVLHGPRKLADCNQKGKVISQDLKQAA